MWLHIFYDLKLCVIISWKMDSFEIALNISFLVINRRSVSIFHCFPTEKRIESSFALWFMAVINVWWMIYVACGWTPFMSLILINFIDFLRFIYLAASLRHSGRYKLKSIQCVCSLCMHIIQLAKEYVLKMVRVASALIYM